MPERGWQELLDQAQPLKTDAEREAWFAGLSDEERNAWVLVLLNIVDWIWDWMEWLRTVCDLGGDGVEIDDQGGQ